MNKSDDKDEKCEHRIQEIIRWNYFLVKRLLLFFFGESPGSEFIASDSLLVIHLGVYLCTYFLVVSFQEMDDVDSDGLSFFGYVVDDW